MYHLVGYGNLGLWILGATVGVIFIVHGIPKIKNPKSVASVYKAPAVFGLYHGLIEFLGGGALILGIFVDFVAFVFALIMLGAIRFKITKWDMPFTAHDKTGWEFDLILLAACLVLLLS